MKNLCIIPARGGSKRIPRKNIKDFLGKPIISYSIKAALDSGLFDEVMVSTDDEEIGNIAKEYGANLPFLRNESIANDFATTYDVLEEVIRKYEEEEGIIFDHVCCIYPCAPFTTKEILHLAYHQLIEEKLDTVFPIVSYANPIQRALKIVNNRVQSFNSQYETMRSQDLEKAYYDPGQFYWMNIMRLFENKKIYSLLSGAVIVDEMEVQDIDNESDWKLAEYKYQLIQNRK